MGGKVQRSFSLQRETVNDRDPTSSKMETNQLCSDLHVNTVTHLPAVYVSHLTHTHTQLPRKVIKVNKNFCSWVFMVHDSNPSTSPCVYTLTCMPLWTAVLWACHGHIYPEFRETMISHKRPSPYWNPLTFPPKGEGGSTPSWGVGHKIAYGIPPLMKDI